jgi:hypothetical protein
VRYLAALYPFFSLIVTDASLILIAPARYGVISGDSASNVRFITEQGTDLIATTADGTVVAYSPGDIAWSVSLTIYWTDLSDPLFNYI